MKKSKILKRCIIAFLAVLCVALLCVPAFASVPVGGELVPILSGWEYNIPSSLNVLLSNSLLFTAGNTYLVYFDNQQYLCEAFDVSALGSSGCILGNGSAFGLPGNNEPFVILSGIDDGGNPNTVLIPADVYSNRTISLAVYQVVESPSAQIFSNITTYADSLRIQLSATSVIEVLAYIVGASVLGVFLWWAVCKAVKGIKSAYLRGKLRL